MGGTIYIINKNDNWKNIFSFFNQNHKLTVHSVLPNVPINRIFCDLQHVPQMYPRRDRTPVKFTSI